MMKMKKLSAALLAVLMVLSMLSGIMGVSAESANGLGGPVAVEEVAVMTSSVTVPGRALPTGILVVDDGWRSVAAGGWVNIELNGIVYRATKGSNAFHEIADAVSAAKASDTIYVAAGTYSAQVTVGKSNLKIYGPNAGVSPNDPSDLSQPNPARLGAAGKVLTNEAVYTGQIRLSEGGSHMVLDGFTIREGNIYCNISARDLIGVTVRNNIISTTAASFYDSDRGFQYGLLMEDNRFTSVNRIATIGGLNNATLRHNYIYNNNYAVVITSAEGGSMGAGCLVEDNYFAYANGIVGYIRATGYLSSVYSIQVRNNYVNSLGPQGVVYNNFIAKTPGNQGSSTAVGTLPGTNIQVQGNTFMNIPSNCIPFIFPYTMPSNISAETLIRYRFMININYNYFDLPENQQLISSEMNGVLNCAYNYFSNGISASQITKFRDTTLVLYPTYANPDMTELTGAARIESVALEKVTIDNETQTVDIDLRGNTMSYVDLSGLVTVSEGCTWKLFEDQTLSEESVNKLLYFDGVSTDRYAEITTPDGETKAIWRIHVTKDYGHEASLIDVVFDSTAVPVPTIEGTSYHYDLPAEMAFVNYELRLSSGASYELFADSLLETPLKDIGGYIPNGGYQIYVLVTSEDKTVTAKYCLDFQRPYSEFYDPSVVNGILPDGGFVIRQRNHWIAYYCTNLVAEETFNFAVTPGATYKIYADQAKTKELSSAASPKKLTLTDGENTFYVEVTDSANSNLYTFIVYNGVRSSDNTIISLSNGAASVSGNTITVAGTGDTLMTRFITLSPYATVRVFADSAKKVEVDYTSVPVQDADSIRVVDDRTFTISTKLYTNVYIVECTAENGAKKDYIMTVERAVPAVSYADVSSGVWYASYIDAVTAAGMMTGETIDDVTTFRPNDCASRQEIAVVVCRLMGINGDPFTSLSVPYADAGEIAEWAKGYVKACYATGAILGSSEGNKVYFRPTKNISRQEIMVIFARILNLNEKADLSAYKDANKVPAWARDSVEKVVAAGLIRGDDNGNLNPGADIRRSELATIISRVLDYKA